MLATLSQIGESPSPTTESDLDKARYEIERLLATVLLATDRVSGTDKAFKSKTNAPQNFKLVSSAREYIEQIKDYVGVMMNLLGNMMWIKLLHARFSLPQTEANDLADARQTVEIAARQKSLRQTEKSLMDELRRVEEQQIHLRAEHQQTDIANGNWEAARCLQTRLGVNSIHALQNPTTKTLGQYVRVVGLQIKHPTEHKEIAALNLELEQISAKLLSTCKNLATDTVHNMEPQENKIEEFRSDILTIKALSTQVFDRYQNLLKRPYTPAKPKILPSCKQ
jgi:hypothetical protein